MATTTRTYPIPRAVGSTIDRACAKDASDDAAIRAAASGRVSSFHLPLLASVTSWRPGAEWAKSVLDREQESVARRKDSLLAAVGYDPNSYMYHGVLDSNYPNHELICSLARSPVGTDGTDALEKWDGLDWGRAEVSPDGLQYVLLDEDVLADVLDAVDTGSAGVLLRPFEPKAWVRDAEVQDYMVPTAQPPDRQTGVMVAFYPDSETADQLAVPGGEPTEDLHVTLAYLGDTEEEPIDYMAVQRATAKWARRMSPVDGEISGSGLFTASGAPITVALVDVPALPEAREMLVNILESEGVRVQKDHGYTPHITLAYDEVDCEVPNLPLCFGDVAVKYGDDTTRYSLGTPVIAAGAPPDLMYAVVDEFDTNAVLDLLRVMPGPIAYRRSGGHWVKDNVLLSKLIGVDPPPVVEIPRDQAQTVIDQVDAYDKAHPAKPVAAAGLWEEDLHPRQAGRFASKNGPATTSPTGPGSENKQTSVNRAAHALTDAQVGLGPDAMRRQRNLVRESHDRAPLGPDGKPIHRRAGGPGGGVRSPSSGGSSGSSGVSSGASIHQEPWKVLGPRDNIRPGTVPPGFWAHQPTGFQDWLTGFLRAQKNQRSGTSATPHHKQKGQRTAAQKASTAKAQAASHTSTAQSTRAKHGAGKHQKPSWWDQVPRQYKASMMAFLNAAERRAHGGGGGAGGGSGAGAGAGGVPPEERLRHLNRADRQFDLKFAREGLGESRRREIFDRQIVGTQDRLLRSGANPTAVAAIMRQKISAEKAARDNFERQRRTAAQQEQVRRMAARNSELDTRDSEAITADASFMPPQLINYWIHGEGAAKVRWGTDGDFDRCRRLLLEEGVPAHMVNGATANLHFLATGQYPGKGRGHGTVAALRAIVADVSTMPAQLQAYWSHGKGAAKIRWGVSGDFNRCRRALAKYLRPDQLAGACANLHHLAIGVWPGEEH